MVDGGRRWLMDNGEWLMAEPNTPRRFQSLEMPRGVF
jgi:hypothetical protein